jgi:hypothetical protein
LTPSVVTERDDIGAPLQLEPVQHQHRQAHVVEAPAHQLGQRAAGALDEAPRDRRARRRPRRLLNLRADRLGCALVAAGRDAGQHPLEHDPREQIAVGEVLVGRQPHLGAAVGAPDPRPLDRDAPTAERHLADLVAVTHRDPISDVLALRADDVDHFLFQQLGQHAQPNTDAQGEQPLLRRPDQLPQRLLNARRQHDLIHARLRERYVPLHGGSLL